MLRPIEWFLHLLGRNQAPVQIISPGVIGTGEPASRGLAGLCCAYPRPTVPAYIDERANLIVAVAHNDHRFGSEFDHQEIPGMRQIAHVGYAEPMPQQYSLHVGVENARVRVELSLQRVARGMASDKFGKIWMAHVHSR